MVRYLDKSEYGKCRPLWEEAFPEDSKSFADYYFSEKLPGSKVLAIEGEEGNLLTMAHLNPYMISVNGKKWELPYIVGVATAADQRHKGYMRQVLYKMLRDLNQEKKPFCFLMPAAETIYRPFQFAFIYDQPVWKPEDEPEKDLEKCPVDLAKKAETAAHWMNDWLEKHYEVYAVRDKAYMELLKKELESEAGEVTGWYEKDGKLHALEAWWGLGKREERFYYTLSEIEPSDTHPAIMARITDIKALLEVIGLNDDAPEDRFQAVLSIKDPIIPENEGRWLWKLEKNGGTLERMIGLGLQTEAEGSEQAILSSSEVLEINIDELAQWIFGYRPLEEISGVAPPFWTEYVRTLRGVFLDEVV